jgi:hypothetical protein
MFFRIGQGIPDLIDIALFHYGTGGADDTALPAEDTGRIRQAPVVGRGDQGIKAPVIVIEGAYRLYFVANPNTAAAEDAFLGIPDQGGAAGVLLPGALFSGIPDFSDPQIMGDSLQFTVVVPLTDEAVRGVVGQHQFHYGAPGLANPGRIGLNHHPVGCRVDTAGQKGPGIFHFHHTDPAGSFGTKFRMVTEGGDINPCCLGGFQYSAAGFYLYFPPVNGKVNHLKTSFYSYFASIGRGANQGQAERLH